MFCKNCGIRLADTAVFCSGCGLRVAEANPGTQASVMETAHKLPVFNTSVLFQVSLQGFSADMTTANGSYDTIELGSMNGEQIHQLFQRLISLKTPSDESGSEDLCPPVITILPPDGNVHSFEITGGSLLYANSNTILSAEEAIAVIHGDAATGRKKRASTDAKGNVHKSSLQWGSDHKDVRGLTPVRLHHIPPTDRVRATASTINTVNTVQIQDHVVKSSTSGNAYKAPIAFIFLAIVLALGGIAISEPGLTIISLLVAAGLLWLSIYLKGSAKGHFRLGFDWNLNAVWATIAGQQSPSFLGNANCILGFRLEQETLNNMRHMNVGNSSTRINTAVRTDTKIWNLIVDKTDGSRIPLWHFYTEADGNRIVIAANQLLSQQI